MIRKALSKEGEGKRAPLFRFLRKIAQRSKFFLLNVLS
jgi:hypothetical protein